MTLSIDDLRYTRSGSANIAYHVRGSGTIDILLMSFVISIDDLVGDPKIRGFVDRLASFARVILYDRRGVGYSDPITDADPPTLEQQVLDALAVLDEVRASHVCVVADASSAVASMLAGEHPNRVTRLVLDHPAAGIAADPDFPIRLSPEDLEHELDTAEEEHKTGRPVGFMRALPTVVADAKEREWFMRLVRRGVSPGTMRRFVRVLLEADVRYILPTMRTPTLVICRRDVEPSWKGRIEHFTRLLPNATVAHLPGADPLMFVGDMEPIADAIKDFTGSRSVAESSSRALATVLFTDVVDSTRQAALLGDKRWRELLDEHDALVADQLGRYSGRQVKTTGDGLLATFTGPAAAVRCAIAIRDAVAGLGVDIRSGVHTGEIELRGDDIAGIGVVIARRLCDGGTAGEVLVSRTVTDLVAGSGLEFDDAGERELKGVPGIWSVYSVRS